MNAPDRAVAPGGQVVKLIRLTGTGNRPWRGQRGQPARDGWWWTVTAPGGIELAAVFIGPDVDITKDSSEESDALLAARKGRARAAVARAAAALEAVTAALPVSPFRLADLVPVQVHDPGPGYRGGKGIQRFGDPLNDN